MTVTLRSAGFFWLVGQGGCGVLTSPALGKAGASILLGRPLPSDQTDLGLTANQLGVGRLTATID
jgi:D-arginine dehydrogenase